MTYEPQSPSSAYHSHLTNPPGVNLTPSPLSEQQFKTQLEKTKGQGRALSLLLEQEKNKEKGWTLATQREKNATNAVKYAREKENTAQEKHYLAADKIDTATSFREIDHARLRGKLSDTAKQRLEIELGAKQDENKYLTDARKLQQEKHALALKNGRVDIDLLKAQLNDRRELLRTEGHRMIGGGN